MASHKVPRECSVLRSKSYALWAARHLPVSSSKLVKRFCIALLTLNAFTWCLGLVQMGGEGNVFGRSHAWSFFSLKRMKSSNRLCCMHIIWEDCESLEAHHVDWLD